MPEYGTHHFAEKVALVSDIRGPVGRAVSMQLALLGCFVVGVDPDSTADGRNSIQELVNLGTLAMCVSADPGTVAGCERITGEVRKAFGRLDLLVNCLKKEPESSFETNTEADFVGLLQANLGSVQFLTDVAVGLMSDRPNPRIVNIAWTVDSDPLFTAAQAGIVSLTEMAALKLPKNFRVNCVRVGYKTSAQGRGDEREKAPGPFVDSDDVARAVLFLLSSESTAMNGQVIHLGRSD